jgi:hypothetical protein
MQKSLKQNYDQETAQKLMQIITKHNPGRHELIKRREKVSIEYIAVI